MSKLEPLIISIVELFEEYAGQDGKKNLSMDELKELMDKEVTRPEFQKMVNADDANKAMDFLDKNGDGSVNFNEFSRCIAALARGYFKTKNGKKGKGKRRGKGKGKGKGEEEEDEEDELEEEESGTGAGETDVVEED